MHGHLEKRSDKSWTIVMRRDGIRLPENENASIRLSKEINVKLKKKWPG